MSLLRISAIAGLFFSQLSFGQYSQVALVPASFNTEANEFAIRKFKDALVFVGAAKDELGNQLYDSKTNEPFTDLFLVSDSAITDFKIPNASGVSSLASTRAFDGPISASDDGNIIFFTNNLIGRRVKQTLGLFYTIKTPLGYGDPIAFSFNSNDYNTTHPFYDEATGYLYFSSDISSGIGGMDIYRVKFKDGTVGEVETLGINSVSNDIFPSVYDGKIYVTSNRVGSMGGYDLFVCEGDSVQRMEAPFNSSHDDLAICWLSSTTGFYSSNRIINEIQSSDSTRKKDDDIYAFVIEDALNILSLDVTLTDENGNPIESALLTVIDDSTGKMKFSSLSDFEGRVVGVLDTLGNDAANAYNIIITKEGYVFKEQVIVADAKDTSSMDIVAIDTDATTLEAEMELSDVLDIKTIYYDFNSSALRQESKVELDKLVLFMNDHPEVLVELGSHTDCTGSDHYNLWLSKRRAASAVSYIKSRLKVPGKILSQGYGENAPVVSCDCESNSCSDSDNQKNRRTEFIITSLNFSSQK